MSEAAEYHIDNIQSFIGKEIGVTDWMTIDQDRIDRFAEVTEDRNPLHVDPAASAEGPYGQPIAHGFLTLSLLSRFAYQNQLLPAGVAHGINYGFERVRFMSPVPVGSRIRNRQTLLGAANKGEGRYVIRTRNAIEIEDAPMPALLADWLCIFMRDAGDDASSTAAE
ncbi:MAG: MaoC family dehydratase [Alphaproteobacteria bacterium]|nr:MaoC family dehydratase [Alphaproteobacteria bacterium]